MVRYLTIMYGYDPYGYNSYNSHGYSGIWQIILGIICALVVTILLYIFVFPESRKDYLGDFLLFVRNFFDMKYLLIEKILKFFYVFSTIFIICYGVFLLFGDTLFLGLVFLALGPVVQRIVYEIYMLGVLLVKNTMEINKKIDGKKDGASTSTFTDTVSFLQNDSSVDGTKKSSKSYSYSRPVFEKNTWTCQFCGKGNPDSAILCKHCHGDRREVKEAPNGSWICSECCTINPDSDRKCYYCGTIRPIEYIYQGSSDNKGKAGNNTLQNQGHDSLDSVDTTISIGNIGTSSGINCPECGNINDADSTFCMYCGKRLINYNNL